MIAMEERSEGRLETIVACPTEGEASTSLSSAVMDQVLLTEELDDCQECRREVGRETELMLLWYISMRPVKEGVEFKWVSSVVFCSCAWSSAHSWYHVLTV